VKPTLAQEQVDDVTHKRIMAKQSNMEKAIVSLEKRAGSPNPNFESSLNAKVHVNTYSIGNSGIMS